MISIVLFAFLLSNVTVLIVERSSRRFAEHRAYQLGTIDGTRNTLIYVNRNQ